MEVDLSIVPKKHPTLYDIKESFKVIKTKNYDGVMGEDDTCLVVFTNFVLGRKPIILTGTRASGKSCIMRTVATYCKRPAILGKTSEKAPIYDFQRINKSTHLVVPELQKVSATTIEMLKDFGENEDFTYKTANDLTGFRLKAKPYITSKADENAFELGEELLSRLTTVRVNSSEEQNKVVVSWQLDKYKNPLSQRSMTEKDLNELYAYVHSLPDIEELDFAYPPGSYMSRAIPTYFPDSRRDVQKYLRNTFAIALFHFWDRIVYKPKEGKPILLVTPEDIFLNHLLYGKILRDSSLKINEIQYKILEILDKKARDSSFKAMKINDIHKSLLQMGVNVSPSTVKKFCNNLYKSSGFIVKNEDTRPHSYEIGEAFRDFSVELDWEEIIKICEDGIRATFPDLANEYIERFCRNPTTIHPLTGEKIDITKYKIKRDSEIKLAETSSAISDFVTKPKERKEIRIIKELQDEKGFIDAIELEEKLGEKMVENMLIQGIIFQPIPGTYRILE